MNCGEVRSYLYAFLDSELDAPLSIDVQRHLDGCHDCAREAEIERAISNRLGQAIRQNASVPAFTDSIDGDITFSTDGVRERLHERTVDHGSSRRPRLISLAATLAIAVGATGWFMFSARNADSGSDRFVDLVVADFEHFLDDGGSLQIESSDRDVVTKWLEDKTEVAMTLPLPSDPQCRLLGGRKCTIAGAAAAFAVYEMHGVRASLVAVPSSSADFEGMTAVQSSGVAYWVAKRGAYTVLASRRGGLVYAAAAKLPMEELSCLLKRQNVKTSKN